MYTYSGKLHLRNKEKFGKMIVFKANTFNTNRIIGHVDVCLFVHPLSIGASNVFISFLFQKLFP
jgi:hypothetical protein